MAFQMTTEFEQNQFKSLCLFLYELPVEEIPELNAIQVYNRWNRRCQPEVTDVHAVVWLLGYIRDVVPGLKDPKKREFFLEALQADGFM